LAWCGPYKIVGTVGGVDYEIEINPGEVKIYHINMLKRYCHRENEQKEVLHNVDKGTQEGRTTNGRPQLLALALRVEALTTLLVLTLP